MLTYANASQTYWLPDRIKQSVGFGKCFMDWVYQVQVKMHKHTCFCRFLQHSPHEIISMAGKTGTTQDGSGNKAENYSSISATNQHQLRQKMYQ